ncbi:cupin [Aeromicrobium sp. PE09-221]|uniref:cupin domain-containing protein n=1 Tax=Aeromicrobium sp. PE09-221 TaxID=1898043 RepID=UPI000B3E9C8E|nr:cupin domain-containing protein [Aeromicrobium sp. PE09-221]OUZ11957.1 cupin [Aeromicrobium sp. PE09-221]
MAQPPVVKNIEDLTARLIAPDDTVKLLPLAGPSDGSPASVFLEIWEPGGAQPDNSHPDSVEIFLVLSGEAQAVSDEHTVALRQGDVLVLPPGSVHHIQNTSATERLYTVTVMATDNEGSMADGFEALVTNGTPTLLDETDKATIFTRYAAGIA